MGCTAAMPTVATTAKAAAAAAGRMKKKARREDGIKSLSLHVAMLGRRGTLGWEKDTQRKKEKKKTGGGVTCTKYYKYAMVWHTRIRVK